MDNKSLAHTRWNCTYHMIFIPKYRRKIMYGTNKKDLAEINKKLCEMKGVSLIDERICVDHVHLYVGIPPKISISEFMAYLKGKSSLMFFAGTRNTAPNGETGISGRVVIMLQQ